MNKNKLLKIGICVGVILIPLSLASCVVKVKDFEDFRLYNFIKVKKELEQKIDNKIKQLIDENKTQNINHYNSQTKKTNEEIVSLEHLQSKLSKFYKSIKSLKFKNIKTRIIQEQEITKLEKNFLQYNWSKNYWTEYLKHLNMQPLRKER